MLPEDRAGSASARDSETVVPLAEESLSVDKRETETGRVRVSVRTETEDRLIRETLRTERADVERVSVGRELAIGEPLPTIREGADGTVVVPVIEEVLVVEKRLVLREELRIRRIEDKEPVEQTVTVRRQYAEVERLPNEPQETKAGDARADRKSERGD